MIKSSAELTRRKERFSLSWTSPFTRKSSRFSSPFTAATHTNMMDHYQETVRHTAYGYMVIALGAKLAKIDGAVNTAELHHFPAIFNLNSQHYDRPLPTLIKEATHDTLPYSHYVRRIMQFFPHNHNLYQSLTGHLMRFAVIDAPMTGEEIIFINRIRRLFNISDKDFIAALHSYLIPSGTNPYTILGIDRHTPQAAFRHHYHTAIRACHPDQLQHLQAPADIISLANQRIAVLSEAYQTIQRQHKRRKR